MANAVRFVLRVGAVLALLILASPAMARVTKNGQRGAVNYDSVSRIITRSAARERQFDALDRQVAHGTRHLEAQEQHSEDVDDPPVHHRRGYFDPLK